MKKIALLTLGFLLVCNWAFATVGSFDLGSFSLTNPETKDFFNETGLGAFDDEWKFVVPATNLEVVAFSSNSRFFDITNLVGSLWKDGEKIYEASFSIFTDTANKISFDYFSLNSMNLLSGNYVLKLSGVGTSRYSNYDGFVSSSPVPIPGAALLLGSALLGVVGIRRTRAV